MSERIAAFDELAESSLGEISADKLLEATAGMDARLLAVWPEKKKVELELEPVLKKVRVRDLFDRLRNEKKKYELELEPIDRGPIRIRDWRTEKKKAELETDVTPGGGKIPGGIGAEKKKAELEIELGAGGAIDIGGLIDKLERARKEK